MCNPYSTSRTASSDPDDDEDEEATEDGIETTTRTNRGEARE